MFIKYVISNKNFQFFLEEQMSSYIDLIVLGIVVLLILYRLYDVLGTKPQSSHLPHIKVVSKKEFEKIYHMLEKQAEDIESFKGIEIKTSEADKLLSQIKDFDKTDFLKRVSKVFEMILTAFALSDQETIQMLTTPALNKKFSDIISERTANGITLESDLIKIDELGIENVKILQKGTAKITVSITSEQINVLKNAQGELIEGDENFVQKITDIWTFEKNINDSSPVWLLSSTKKKQ